MNNLYLGDCLNVLRDNIPDESISSLTGQRKTEKMLLKYLTVKKIPLGTVYL